MTSHRHSRTCGVNPDHIQSIHALVENLIKPLNYESVSTYVPSSSVAEVVFKDEIEAQILQNALHSHYLGCEFYTLPKKGLFGHERYVVRIHP